MFMWHVLSVCVLVSLLLGAMCWSMVCDCVVSCLQGSKTFFVLNSTEHEIYHAYK